MSGFNPNYSQQPATQGQGQGQHYGNSNGNYRPQLGGMNLPTSSPNLASILPYPQQQHQQQSFDPNQLQQLHNRQQAAMFAQQQQRVQAGQPQSQSQSQGQGHFGALPTSHQNGTYQNNGYTASSSDMMSQQQQAVLTARLQQAQFMQAARQMQAQAQQQQQQQQQQRPRVSPMPTNMSLPIPIQAAAQQQQQQRPMNIQHPHPPPMQRTYSNQSNGGGGQGQGQQAGRPMMPISGYQPNLSNIPFNQGVNQGSSNTPFAYNLPPPTNGSPHLDNSRNKPLPIPFPPVQLPGRRPSWKQSGELESAVASPSDSRPSVSNDNSRPNTASGPEPQKKKRKKDTALEPLAGSSSSVAGGAGAGAGAGAPVGSQIVTMRKDEKPTSIVYFNGVEPAKEEPIVPEKKEQVSRQSLSITGQGLGSGASTTSALVQATAPVERKRGGNAEGMRQSMRNEIARLMYAAGDVQDPNVDSVDYVEDLLVEFLSDLCRPPPPTRSHPGSIHTVQPLTPSSIRHRLSRPGLEKYLARFDYMSAMKLEVDQAKRINEPSAEDLISSVGRSFLGIDDDGTNNTRGGGGGGGGGEKGKRGRPKKEPGQNNGERRKPGPKKGWKAANMGGVGEKGKRGPYKKRTREGTGSVGVKGEA